MPSLAGLGRAGSWTVDIDTEEGVGNDAQWSVTFQHPQICVQAPLITVEVLQHLVDHLKSNKMVEEFFQLACIKDFEMLIGIASGRLVIRVGRDRKLVGSAFPWLLECTLTVEEASSLAEAVAQALEDALPANA